MCAYCSFLKVRWIESGRLHGYSLVLVRVYIALVLGKWVDEKVWQINKNSLYVQG